MNDFIPGQRWISNTESELGLGIVVESEYNRVTMLFLATGERRVYAKDNAPLTRVIFSEGDTIESTEYSKLTVTKVIERNGLVTYVGKTEKNRETSLDEMELNHHIQFNKPQDRLFTGQFDPSAWFQLRYQTWQYCREHQQSPIKGLQGGRTSLIAHQLFIAHEAAGRPTPRIMLADEVGLGKTIEAGLILHHRLNNGLSNRALIIVPESLLHQWLVEMLRRFNLRFSILDEVRCLGIENIDIDYIGESEPSTENPFNTEQLILCSQEFFARHPKRQQQALEAGWDMVIVDEAHHLEWSETSASPEYLFIENLAASTPGLILLTATPEQLGKESHFARLRLLDPDRFYSFSAFLEEETHFQPVAEAAKSLLANQALTPDEKAHLARLVKHDHVDTLLKNLDDPEKSQVAREELVKILLDHHGTGRILFRNSRQTVQGFPDRERQSYALNGTAESLQEDPRTLWLVEKIKALDGQKALLICRHAQTAIELEHIVEKRFGIAAAVFHEGMSIIERDRAAAYFADQESSARLLICSEIGSEGRNFQFVHHLILFDLPDNPDLLQQRIGRLDRIGQRHIIEIHIPYLTGGREHTLFRWYDEGLNAFRHNTSAGQRVAELLHDELQTALEKYDSESLDKLIAKTQTLAQQIEIELHNGRDLLLELNSCRKEEAQELIDQLKQRDNEGVLWPYMEDVFECYGVDTEFHSADCFILRPSEHLRMSHFPGLSEDGMTVTVNRDIALAREELQFLTWEHPMVAAAMDMILSSDTGNAGVSVVKHKDQKAGRFLLECLFIVECSAPPELQVGRFLPHTPIRILIDQNKDDLTDTIEHIELIDSGKKFDKTQIVAFLNSQRKHLTTLLDIAEQNAQAQMNQLITDSQKTMLETMTGEIKRLTRLKQVNPSIREDEIEFQKETAMLLHENIQDAQLRLDAVRFIITS
ncbi:MAG: RNA polymerase-associated protein RapA [Gammaproteobacteria bacterium]|uniref:RNA polymerase-associated protein RapA n=1 Tax=Methylotuvimicrobium sp. TaxID=2822413 RepID=UPI001DF1C2EE|nr:RNA polymerase-associated protein RapA [Gammaproteobacteria bacterium]